ncbi:hypothetical protein ABLA30_12355 [Xenorhabdus nematophila]|uniref:hypothetical protein n=1 Tax=Xenorhabdus nematophila TaxID=628 RepID=UPI0032B83AB7
MSETNLTHESCIDIHECIKEQIIGFSLNDAESDFEEEMKNFITSYDGNSDCLSSLVMYLLFDFIEEKELGEKLPLNNEMIGKFRYVIDYIRQNAESKLEFDKLMKPFQKNKPH